MGRLQLIVTTSLALLAAGGVAWAMQEPLMQQYWDLQSQRGLSEPQQHALEQCEDPGWRALTRVLQQDLDLSCGELWLGNAVALYLGRRERHWLLELVDHPADGPPSSRQRLRVSVALLFAGEPPLVDLPFLLTEPGTSASTRQELVQAARDGRVDGRWADPLLTDPQLLRDFEAQDTADSSRYTRDLRLAAADPAWLTAPERARRTALVLEQVDLLATLQPPTALGRVAGEDGQGLPPEVQAALATRSRDCVDSTSAECLLLAADLLEWAGQSDWEEWWEPEAAREPPASAPQLPTALWEMRYDDGRAIEAARRQLADQAAWIASAPPDRAGTWLVESVAHSPTAYGVVEVRAGLLGDPIHALPLRHATPWTAALAALALGEASGVAVTVHGLDGGVVIVAGGAMRTVGPCGVAPPLPEVLPEAWPARAVLAQATLEGAGAALRGEQASRARRLARLAERLDPIGAAGAGDAVDAVLDTDVHSVSWRLGAAVARDARDVESRVPRGAEAARRLQSEVVAASARSWDVGPELTVCPSILGP